MSLSPEQRDRLQRLLEEELRAAARTAVAGGARPEELAEAVDERRRALELSLAAADDLPGDGVPEEDTEADTQ